MSLFPTAKAVRHCGVETQAVPSKCDPFIIYYFQQLTYFVSHIIPHLFFIYLYKHN